MLRTITVAPNWDFSCSAILYVLALRRGRRQAGAAGHQALASSENLDRSIKSILKSGEIKLRPIYTSTKVFNIMPRKVSVMTLYQDTFCRVDSSSQKQ